MNATAKAARNAMWAKLDTLSTEVLVDLCRKMNADFSEEAGIVLSFAMTLLEERMESSAFVKFCESL
jgi:hypothetical protein